jgi:WD40 repeat protein
METYRFRAFVSYSRSDRQWAKALQARLERYVLPNSLRLINPGVRQDRRPLKPVFRDEDELVPGQGLPERIRKGLEHSQYLIVVCSPRAAASEWVGKEIRDFIALGRGHNILAVVVDGEPNAEAHGAAPELECLPRELRFKPEVEKDAAGNTIVSFSSDPAEPLWVDWRNTNHRNRPMFLRLVAALLSLSSLDELVHRDRVYRRRRAAALWSAIGIAACCIVGLGIELMIQAQKTAIKDGNTLVLLAGKAEQQGDWESTARYALLALRRADRPLIGFDPEKAEDALAAALLSNRRIGAPYGGGTASKMRLLSADGSSLAILAEDGSTHVLDTTTGKPLGRPFSVGSISDKQEKQVVLSADGKALVTSEVSYKPIRQTLFQIWDVAQGTKVRTLTIGDPLAMGGVGISPGNKYLIACTSPSSGMEIHLFDLSTGSDTKLDGGAILGQGRGDGASFEFSPDGVLVAGSSDVGIMVWNTETKEPVAPLIKIGGEGQIGAFALSPDHMTLVAYVDHTLELWDIQTKHNIGGFDHDLIDSMAFSRSGQQLGVVSGNGAEVSQVILQGDSEAHNDLRGGVHTDLGDSEISIQGATQLAFPVDERQVVTDDGTTVRRWKLYWYDRRESLPNMQDSFLSADGSVLELLNKKGQLIPLNSQSLAPIGPPVTVPAAVSFFGSPIVQMDRLTFSSKGNMMAFVTDRGLAVEVVNWLTGEQWQLPIQQYDVKAISLSPDGNLLAAATARQVEPGQRDEKTGKIVQPDGDSVWYSDVQVWDLASRQPDGSAIEIQGEVESVAFSPDGARLALATEQDSIQVWDLKRHAPATSSPIRGDRVVFSPDGHRLLASTLGEEGDTTLQVWDLVTEQSVGQSAKSPVGGVLQARFLEDGNRALLMGDEGAAFWDLKQNLPIGAPFVPDTSNSIFGMTPWTMSLSADESKLMATGSDGTLYSWDIGNTLHLHGQALMDAICSELLPGDLSRLTKAELAAFPALDPRRDADACGR